MKLLTKTTLYFLLTMVPLLAVSGFYLFNQFSKEINYRSDKELISDEIEWIQYLESEADNGVTFILKTPELSVYPVNAPVAPYPSITNTYGYTTKGKEKIPYRQLLQVVSIFGTPYQVIIRQSQEQKTALVTDVTRIMLFVFAGLFAATLIFNWAISKRLWKPFRHSLNKIRSAELQKMEAIHFENTNTQEFNELNTSLNYMTGKMYRDYVNMKEFTENAAHEMQTPVAVVQSKLELLLQDDNLNDGQVQSILQSTTALSRLSKLNEGLLLLAKIENHQYETTAEINLNDLTKKYLHLFEEFIKQKQLNIKTTFDGEFKIKLHPVLAGSLITNLLGNAIKYNYDGGMIEVIISENNYHIRNTSAKEPIDSKKLFTRLHMTNDSGETSNGLGLAIVKKITDVHNLLVSYHTQNGVHSFEIRRS
ncbi:MAG: HAMP domain-containing histidine kinase [Bacteroidota bacterium]|nr:HAMP domain-containing histidine kinase [Bacteroidota bacterium]